MSLAEELYKFFEEEIFPYTDENHPIRLYAVNFIGKSEEELKFIKASAERWVDERKRHQKPLD